MSLASAGSVIPGDLFPSPALPLAASRGAGSGRPLAAAGAVARAGHSARRGRQQRFRPLSPRCNWGLGCFCHHGPRGTEGNG